MKAILLFFLLASLPPPAQVEQAMPVAWAMIQYFPVEAQRTMLCIAHYENRTFNPKAVSQTGDYGITQINLASHRDRIARLGLTPAALLDVDANVRVAADIWAERGFEPWTTAKFCRRR